MEMAQSKKERKISFINPGKADHDICCAYSTYVHTDGRGSVPVKFPYLFSLKKGRFKSSLDAIYIEKNLWTPE
jgi:hypothetical protein